MSCSFVEPSLVGYHFDALDDSTRRRVERHLVGCADCVRAFVELKRSIETREGSARPGPAVRGRLRRAVQRELEPGPRWSWWERPLAVALAATLVLVAAGGVRWLTSVPASPPRALSAR